MDGLTKNKLNKVAVFGPHDRMNYGDFLFPIMIDYAISRNIGDKTSLHKYSIVDSDFASIGAYKSKGFKKLKEDVDLKNIDAIIVSGGECLGATWDRLLSFIYPIWEKIRKSKIATRIFSKIFRLFNNNVYEFPFVIDKNFFDTKIIYNSVGGGKGLSSQLLDRLKKADYLAVRENATYNYFKEKDIPNVYLVPDSAIILSDVYAKNEVPCRNYIYFQLSNYKYQNSFPQIISQLTKLLEETKLNVVLGPIGTALGHEDHIVLEKIFKKFNNDRVFFNKDYSIGNILSLIANSECYVGTSLHGIITAMSFGIPYIGLNPNQGKIKSYIESWGIDELKSVCDCDNFLPTLLNILNSDLNFSEKIIKKTTEQKELYYQSIERILSIVSI